MDNLIKLRHELHQNPELSNHEYQTAQRIQRFFMELNPDKVINLSKTGKAFVFDSQKPGKTTIFRAELDALPIFEHNNLHYQSANDGIAHSCGHDGHMTILAGLATKINQKRPNSGKVVFLYQPAEETEQGANDVVEDKNFNSIKPDFIFALHNIPGAETHSIFVREGTFAAASKGMTVKLIGKTSHAAQPEKGVNPDLAISKIIQQVHELREQNSIFSDLVLLTVINIQLGEIAFGTSAGYAEIRFTLRAFQNEDMALLTSKTEKIIETISMEQKLHFEIDYSEVFPATVNSPQTVQIIKDAANENKLKLVEMEKPFRWSEDFGYYTEQHIGGFFGLGAGKNSPSLHNPDYDFPDEILETGINMFFSIYNLIYFK